MTRTEFLDNVTAWYELIEFCNEEDCSICEDIYSDDEKDDYINERTVEWAQDLGWQDLWGRLDSIPTGSDYYRINDWGDFEELGYDDFEAYKSDVLDWMDDGDYWEDEEGEETFAFTGNTWETEENTEEDIPFEPEDFSVSDLIDMCGATLVSVQADNLRRIQEADRAFEQFIDVNVPKVLK